MQVRARPAFEAGGVESQIHALSPADFLDRAPSPYGVEQRQTCPPRSSLKLQEARRSPADGRTCPPYVLRGPGLATMVKRSWGSATRCPTRSLLASLNLSRFICQIAPEAGERELNDLRGPGALQTGMNQLFRCHPLSPLAAVLEKP